MANRIADKKVRLFYILTDGCNSNITSLHEHHVEFLNLNEEATTVHKDELFNSLKETKEKFKTLENHFHSILSTLSEEQIDTCQGIIDEVKNKIDSLRQEIINSLVEFEKRLKISTNTTNQPKKTNVDFAPEKLSSETEFIPYIQWRFDICGHYEQNKFSIESYEIQRRHLEKYLDETLRAILTNQAPNMNQFPVLPEGSTTMVPEFPVKNECCLSILDEYFDKKHPKMMRLWTFTQLYQNGQFEKEKVQDMWNRILKHYHASGISTMNEETHMKLYFITALRNQQMKQEILRHASSKSLEELVKIGESWQIGDDISSKLRPTNTNTIQTNRISGFKRSKEDHMAKMAVFMNKQKRKGRCFRCDKKGCDGKSRCSAIDSTCHRCGLVGHIAPVCQREADELPFKKKDVWSRLGNKEDDKEKS